MQKLFQKFEEENIRYLHFKSNTHLDDSFHNRADFDVLVDKQRIIDIEKIICECNGKRHNPSHIGSYPGVDNWLIFDDSDGNIYHLHLHYQLATGKALVKDYVLPWNDLLFSSRIKDPQYGIYITDPALELIMLATRSVLKAKSFDFFKKLLGLYTLPKSMKKEWDDLYQKVSHDKVIQYLGILYPNSSFKLMSYLTKEHLTAKDYLGLHNIVRKEMCLHRRYSCAKSSIKSRYYMLVSSINKFRNRKMGGVSIIKKTSLQGGLIIAFVGVDGAGKSTMSNEIKKWIGRKIECKRFYMGVGDGKTTIFVSIMKRIKGLVKQDGGNKRLKEYGDDEMAMISKNISFFKNPVGYLKKYSKLRMIISVEKNNYKKIQKMHKYRLNGGISILDRFPQLEIYGQNDGPKVPIYIRLFGNNYFVKRMLNSELKYLSIVKTVKPDIVFRLNISVDTCISRKPENNNREMFEKKINDLNKLSFQGARIIDIDAELPYEEELLTIKKYLWRFI